MPPMPDPATVEIHRAGQVADREAFLRRMPNAIVACHRREAAPNLAPLWYLWTGSEFWISTVTWTAVKNCGATSA